MYVGMALFFLVVGGIGVAPDALASCSFRIATRIEPDRFNQLFTMHGTTDGLLHGHAYPQSASAITWFRFRSSARDMAFPVHERPWLLGDAVRRSGPLSYFSFPASLAAAPAMGWFAYAPLTERAFARGPGTDLWAIEASLSMASARRRRGSISSPPLSACGVAVGMTIIRKLSVFRLDDPAVDVGANCVGDTAVDRRTDHAVVRLPARLLTFSTRKREARRIRCGSTCSGSSGIRRSTS